MLPKNFTFVDTETTGFKPGKDKVIEIAIIRVESGLIVDEFVTLINPNRFVSNRITSFTGIRPADLIDAPKFYEIAENILQRLENSIFVAHNATFDYNFLKAEFKSAGMNFNLPKVCTVSLSRKFYPQIKKFNLSKIINYFNFQCDSRHRAYDDAYVLYQLFEKIKEDYEDEDIEVIFDKYIKYPETLFEKLARNSKAFN